MKGSYSIMGLDTIIICDDKFSKTDHWKINSEMKMLNEKAKLVYQNKNWRWQN